LGVLHSFAYGVPVITSRGVLHGPEVTNLRHGENSVLYEGSWESLAEVLIKLGNDPEYCSRLGRNGYNHYSRRRTLAHMVEGFLRAVTFATRGWERNLVPFPQ